MTELIRGLKFILGYDYTRVPKGEPNHGCGIHPGHLIYSLKGSAGAVVFSINTGIYPPSVEREWPDKIIGRAKAEPYGWSLDLHTHAPQDEYWHNAKTCEYLGGKPCWNSQLGGERKLFISWAEKGEDFLWSELERLYEKELRYATTFEI